MNRAVNRLGSEALSLRDKSRLATGHPVGFLPRRYCLLAQVSAIDAVYREIETP